ncbi:MAG: lysophospholipid acyltransferase family protein [Bacteroidales bacterium]|nr:lysophospholipid acyltransferase family protein [Bacteroidales bacterium]
MQKIFFYLFYFFSWLLSIMPLKIQYLNADIIYIILYYIISYRKKVVYTNLKNSFPEKSEKERKIIEKKFYKHLADLFIENISIHFIKEKEILKRVKFTNIEVLNNYYEQNKSVIGVLGHYGNWELYLGMPLITKHLNIGVYKKLSNKSFDNFFKKTRQKFGAKPVEMQNTVRTIIKYTKEKKLSFAGFVSDQTPTKSESHYWTKFLNQDTPVFLGVEKIAKKTNQAVVFLDMRKVKRGYYQVEIIKLFDNPKETKEYEITECHVKLLEKIIKEEPEYWLWSHRRWKHKKPNDK